MYHVRLFNQRGKMVLQTWNVGTVSRDMEISAALSRPEIAYIEWWSDDVDDPQPLQRVYRERSS